MTVVASQMYIKVREEKRNGCQIYPQRNRVRKNVVAFSEVDYDLTESLLSLDNGCVELILLGPGFNEKYRIDTVG